MQRREFITLLGSTAAAWPFRAHAQHPERMRRIGVLLPATADDTKFHTWIGAFLQALAVSGWTIGSNLRIDTRWASASADAIRSQAAELVALAPDVILAHGASTVRPLLQLTRTVPIVFPIVGDPVGAGFTDSLKRPGGNATGFMSFEYGMAGNGWNFSRRLCRARHERRSFVIPPKAPETVCMPSFRLWRRHSGLRSALGQDASVANDPISDMGRTCNKLFSKLLSSPFRSFSVSHYDTGS